MALGIALGVGFSADSGWLCCMSPFTMFFPCGSGTHPAHRASSVLSRTTFVFRYPFLPCGCEGGRVRRPLHAAWSAVEMK